MKISSKKCCCIFGGYKCSSESLNSSSYKIRYLQWTLPESIFLHGDIDDVDDQSWRSVVFVYERIRRKLQAVIEFHVIIILVKCFICIEVFFRLLQNKCSYILEFPQMIHFMCIYLKSLVLHLIFTLQPKKSYMSHADLQTPARIHCCWHMFVTFLRLWSENSNQFTHC